jgi:Rrf2 family transcriptional regulator, cysteine metabolism repressor
MRVSTKGDYGVRALVELSHRYGEGPVQSAEIARRQCIPEPYLDQLLTTLRRAGFIRSVRGPQGGHALVRPPAEITLAEVIEALEGSLAPISCLDDAVCSRPGVCAQREVWERVHQATRRILSEVSINDLAEKEREATAAPRYYI